MCIDIWRNYFPIFSIWSYILRVNFFFYLFVPQRHGIIRQWQTRERNCLCIGQSYERTANRYTWMVETFLFAPFEKHLPSLVWMNKWKMAYGGVNFRPTTVGTNTTNSHEQTTCELDGRCIRNLHVRLQCEFYRQHNFPPNCLQLKYISKFHAIVRLSQYAWM